MVGGSQRLRAAGAALALAGVLALVVPSLGFASVHADRPVSVAVADDGSAALGITDVSAPASVDGPSDGATIFRLSDNLGSFDQADLGATVTTVERSDGTVERDPPLTAAVAGSGDQFDVVLSCDREDPSFDGNYTVTVHLTADGESVSVTATRTTDASVSISCENAAVVVEGGQNRNQPIETDGSVEIGDDAKINGRVDAGGSVTAGRGTKFNGRVDSGDSITVGSDVKFNGRIDSGGSVTAGDGTKFNSRIDSGGSITVGANSKFNGAIDAGGSVTAGDGTKFNNRTDSGGSVSTGDESTVNGDITADGDVEIGNGTRVNADIAAGGNVWLRSDSTVNGNVESDGTVYVGCDVGVDEADITAEDTVYTC